jgi:hypothetical protein
MKDIIKALASLVIFFSCSLFAIADTVKPTKSADEKELATFHWMVELKDGEVIDDIRVQEIVVNDSVIMLGREEVSGIVLTTIYYYAISIDNFKKARRINS